MIAQVPVFASAHLNELDARFLKPTLFGQARFNTRNPGKAQSNHLLAAWCGSLGKRHFVKTNEQFSNIPGQFCRARAKLSAG